MSKPKSETTTANPATPKTRKPRVPRTLSPTAEKLKRELAELRIVEKITPQLAGLSSFGLNLISDAITNAKYPVVTPAETAVQS